MSLPSQLDDEINNFGIHQLGGRVLPNWALLEQQVFKYFDQCGHNSTRVDALFNRFARFWSLLFQLYRFEEADMFWEMPLKYAVTWEAQRNKTLHKGTPYYFRAMAAIGARNIDRGFLFFHQAAQEDDKTFGSAVTAPAWSFVTLDYANVHQAALHLVKSRADWLNRRIQDYQARGRGSLTMDRLRKRVLLQPQLPDATISFTHSVFRAENLLSLSPQFRSSRFASQLELDALTGLSRIAESWLKNRQPPTNKRERQLGGQLRRFFAGQGWSLTRQELSQINKADFDNTITALLDGQQGPLLRVYQASQADLLVTYAVRNHAAHDVTSSQVVYMRFEELLDRVFHGLFVVAEKLF